MREFEFLILIVDDLEEEHPAQLADALGVAIDADILAHDVLDGFDEWCGRTWLRGLLIEGGLQFVDGLLEASLIAESLDELHGVPSASKGGIFSTLASSRLSTPSSAYLASRASSTARACAPYFVNTSRFFTFSARSRRVSGLRSKATWQMRSKGSRSLPSSSAMGSSGRPSASSSSTMACLRSAAFQRFRKSSRLAKRFFSAFLVKSRKALGDELAVLVEIFHPLGDDRGADAIDIDFPPASFVLAEY